MQAPETHRAIDAVWRIESARLIAGLAQIVRDVGVAEDLAHDALVAALEQWPESGVPEKPGAWLMGTAKHRAMDLFRRNKRLAHKLEELAQSGIALLVVEHLMGFIDHITDRVIVMNAGKEIFEGVLADAVKNPRVVEVFLGGEDAA